MVELVERQDEHDMEEKGGDPVYSSIRSHWDWVKVGITEILEQNPQLTFRLEDVYAACVAGNAHLWIADEGFVVTTSETDEFTEEKTFLIWLAWAKELGNNCVLKYYPFFSKAAKEAGFKKIEVRTAVNAMEKYLLKEGWQKDTVVYTRDL